MDKRQCKRCCVVKALEDFKDTNKYCERCLEMEREKYQKNREKNRERWQKYYRNNKTEILEKGKEYNKEYRELEVFCDFCQCKVKNVGGLNTYKQRSINIMKRFKMMRKKK